MGFKPGQPAPVLALLAPTSGVLPLGALLDYRLSPTMDGDSWRAGTLS